MLCREFSATLRGRLGSSAISLLDAPGYSMTLIQSDVPQSEAETKPASTWVATPSSALALRDFA